MTPKFQYSSTVPVSYMTTDTMAAETHFELQPHSRLLQLPREIRDLIYDYVLVRDVISIECAVVNFPKAADVASFSPRFCTDFTKLFPSRSPWAHRRLWSIPAFDIDVAFSQVDLVKEPRFVQMTYQLAVNPSHDIGIRLLQTCKQVYTEARETFYVKNLFSFTGDFRIPTAFAFLCDRPAKSLLLISSMELALTEDSNMRGTTEAHYPIVRRSTDSLVLQYAYNHFTDLCTLLSTSRMRLRRLHLTVDSLAERYGKLPESIQECLSWEALKTTESRPWIASWIEPLLKLETLDFIAIYWIFDRPRIQRMADTVSLMSEQMIAGTQSELKTLPDLRGDPELNFRLLYQSGSNGKTHAICGLPEETSWWSNYRLHGEGSEPIKDIDDDYEEHDMAVWPKHLQDMTTVLSCVYVCYCELSRARS
ncbi:hypothetical protein EJ02DRAFT_215372 [Clathrospora elynae]|uniref:F-box domain-containing protein n=1 Tax=Clathrospora elynae TaxID=706981 RepID=A0A6A5T345_9PLEO|nr:hypothetical protein EJ02DRAFT_215372 [Clathrospora elynae]